jgi:hypothetical protein
MRFPLIIEKIPRVPVFQGVLPQGVAVRDTRAMLGAEHALWGYNGPLLHRMEKAKAIAYILATLATFHALSSCDFLI